MERDKFLPIGSVVILKGAEKKLMLTGYLPVETSGTKSVAYDYSACLYPEGVLRPTETFLVNHNDIENVFFLGYESEEYREFDNSIKEKLNELKKSKAKDISFNKEISKQSDNIFDNLRE